MSVKNGYNQHVCLISNIFFNSSYQLEGEQEKKASTGAAKLLRCTLSLWHAHLMYARAICNMHLRPRASHLQLSQRRRRTAEVKESSFL